MNRLTVIAFSAAFALCGCATTKTTQPTLAACDPAADKPPRGSVGCASPGSVYTQDDIRKTGKTTLGGALSLLDPSLTVSRPY
jgi:hypothetical protein